MRVLHVVESWPPIASGYAQRSHGLISAQAAAGIEVRAVVSSRQWVYGDGETRDLAAAGSVSVVEQSRRERRWRRLRPFMIDFDAHLRHLDAVLERWPADVVHSHWASALGQVASTAARRRGLVRVAEERFDLAGAVVAQTPRLTPVEGLLRRWFTRHLDDADAVIAASRPLADFIAECKPHVTERMHTVANAVDAARFYPGSSDAELRRAWNVPDDGFILGTTAKILRYEGLDRLLPLIEALRERGMTSVCAVVVGDGPERLALQAEAQRRHLPILFPGVLPPERIADAYRSFDLFVVPRRSTTVTQKASPLKVLEAMACGLPIVAHGVGDIGELLADGRGVVLADWKTSGLEGWGDAVMTLGKDPERRRRLGEAAATHALAQGTWERRAEACARIYQGVIEGRGRKGRSL